MVVPVLKGIEKLLLSMLSKSTYIFLVLFEPLVHVVFRIVSISKSDPSFLRAHII